METGKLDTNWYRNKIKGGIAETVCRTHFEALGYSVESTGIEQIAPMFCKLQGLPSGNYMEDVRQFQRLPDFLISRVHPATTGAQAGKADAVFVEAKYRTAVVFETFTQELIATYAHLLEKKMRFIVYLVCKRYKMKEADTAFTQASTVWVNFFNPAVSKTNGDTGWHQAGQWEKFATIPLYQGMQPNVNFNTLHADIIQPVLHELLD
ncbi:MAG: hypothetical protein WA056_02355 [Gallionella sp.]